VADIEVSTAEDGSFRVVVDGTSAHDVHVADDYVSRLDVTDVDRVELVRESFEFLLEREPKESIMRSFELSVIERYFPEYTGEIVKRLH
jgi:hypothetical protein